MNPAGLYCLLPNKTGETYKKMVNALNNLIPSGRPTKILVEFEKASMTAFQEGFPDAVVTGCYFHLCQSIIRKVNELGFKLAYETDMTFREYIRCLPALAFVPCSDVITTFEPLIEVAPERQNIDALLKFFENTCI